MGLTGDIHLDVREIESSQDEEKIKFLHAGRKASETNPQNG
jgi:hypothetical protein